MGREEASRRNFLIQSLSGLSSAWFASRLPAILAAQEHAHRAAQSTHPVNFEFLTPEQAVEMEAVAAQIIPADDTPGAREARVIYFIDRALATFESGRRELYLQGLEDLKRRAAQLSPPSKKFSELTSAQQVELLQAIEKSEFFELVRIHTVAGFLANPEYGGNRDKIGWKLLGFEDRFSFQPPFGYYDRGSHGEGSNG